MVPQIRGTTFEQGQGFTLHGDFWSEFGIFENIPILILELVSSVQHRRGSIIDPRKVREH